MKTRVVFFALFLIASHCLSLVYVVTTISDDPNDPGSFRYAINGLAAGLGSTITFNISTDDSNPNCQPSTTIVLTAPLPPIRDSVTISGDTEMSDDGVTPLIQIDGSQLTAAQGSVDGLTFLQSSNVRSLILTGFPGSAIVFGGSNSKYSSRVEGCYIGIDGNQSPVGNGVGITVLNQNCIIGGTGIANTISGNLVAGIVLTGSAARNNVVYNNMIGVDPTGGSYTIPNNDGIQICNGATGNIIGFSGTIGANVISGNNRWGILIQGSSSNSILNNYIGVASDGASALGNGGGASTLDLASAVFGGGIFIDGASFTTVFQNVVSANFGPGIQLTRGANNTALVYNYVGVDSTGSQQVGNIGDGVLLGDSTSANPTVWNNAIGGYNPTPAGIVTGSGNLISGNGANGINIISGSNDLIQGNLIGTDVTSTVTIPNTGDGIQATGTNETIGGALGGFGNTAAGNNGDGIQLNACQFATVQNNSVGVDAILGTTPLPNAGNGITIQDGSQNRIGATGTSARNWICSNQGSGIWISSNNNIVQGNFVGLGADTATILGNGTTPTVDAGIKIVSGSGNLIGVSYAPNFLSVNVVCGSVGDGIRLDGPAVTGNSLLGNWIGFVPDTTAVFGPVASSYTVNGQNGIGLYSGANNNQIGDVAPNAGNWIATDTGDYSVYVVDGGNSSSTVQNSIRGNSLMMLGTQPANFPNNYPINLYTATSDGATNAPGSVRAGPNALLDFPDVAGVFASGTQFVFSGTYSGVPLSHVRLDLYQADPADANFVLHYVQTNDLTTDVNGNCPFNLPLWGNLAAFSLGATATDDFGNTSELSNCVTVPEIFQFAASAPTVTVNEAAGTLQLTISRMGYVDRPTVSGLARRISAAWREPITLR